MGLYPEIFKTHDENLTSGEDAESSIDNSVNSSDSSKDSE